MRCTSVITEWYKNNWSNNDAVIHCAIDRMRIVFLRYNFTNGNAYRLCIAHRVCYYGLLIILPWMRRCHIPYNNMDCGENTNHGDDISWHIIYIYHVMQCSVNDSSKHYMYFVRIHHCLLFSNIWLKLWKPKLKKKMVSKLKNVSQFL